MPGSWAYGRGGCRAIPAPRRAGRTTSSGGGRRSWWSCPRASSPMRALAATPVRCCGWRGTPPDEHLGGRPRHAALAAGRRRVRGHLDHAALVGAHADGAIALADLDVEAELAAVHDLAQRRAHGAVRALHGAGHVLHAHLEADRRIPLG